MSFAFDFSPSSLAELARADAARALAEDVRGGDLTAALVPEGRRGQARVLARESAVICGAPWVEATLRQVDPALQFRWLVLWVPVIGNVIAYFGRKIKLGRKSPFGGRPFAGELLVEMTPLAPAPALGKPLDGDTCALVVGTEAFSARLSQPLAGWLASDAPIRVQAQFLKPKIALARFPQDTSFRVVAQERLVGQGRVLQVLSQAAVERRTGADDARGAG
jgi:hypothetical protein